MNVTRAGRSYVVEDDERTAAWDYWTAEFGGVWEEPTRLVIERFCRPELDYVDIGAWVGPTVLWAAPLSRRCIAVEPDPTALESLHRTVALNDLENVTVVAAAISDHVGMDVIEQGEAWGDSTSSIITRDRSKPLIPVDCLTLADLWASEKIGACSLIKMDVEGGEAVILPASLDFLHDLRVPILLSLHLEWLNNRLRDALLAAVGTFEVEPVDSTNSSFRTVVLS